MIHELLFGVLFSLGKYKEPEPEPEIPENETPDLAPLPEPEPEVIPPSPSEILKEPALLFRGTYGEFLEYDRRHLHLMNVIGEYIQEEPRKIAVQRSFATAVFEDAKSIHFSQAPGSYLIQDKKSIFVRKIEAEILFRDPQSMYVSNADANYLTQDLIWHGVVFHTGDVALNDGYHVFLHSLQKSMVTDDGHGYATASSFTLEVAQETLGFIGSYASQGNVAYRDIKRDEMGICYTISEHGRKDDSGSFGIGNSTMNLAIQTGDDYHNFGIRRLDGEYAVVIPLFESTT